MYCSIAGDYDNAFPAAIDAHVSLLSGVMYPSAEEVTIDGYDLQFGTNTLGTFSLSASIRVFMSNTFAQATSI